MPLLIRITTGLVAGTLIFTATTTDLTVLYGIAAVAWVIIGLTLAVRWEDIE